MLLLIVQALQSIPDVTIRFPIPWVDLNCEYISVLFYQGFLVFLVYSGFFVFYKVYPHLSSKLMTKVATIWYLF